MFWVQASMLYRQRFRAPMLCEHARERLLTAIAETRELRSQTLEWEIQHMLRLALGLPRRGCPLREVVCDVHHKDVGTVIFREPVRGKLAVLCLWQPASFLHCLAECTAQDVLNTERVLVLLQLSTRQAEFSALLEDEDLTVVEKENGCIRSVTQGLGDLARGLGARVGTALPSLPAAAYRVRVGRVGGASPWGSCKLLDTRPGAAQLI
eukprot:277948-Rhodomonas_salina.1